MNPPSSILIAGAGFLGTQLAELLAEAGCHAYTLRRSPTPLQASTAPASTPTRIHPIQADLLETSTLADLPATIDAVVFAASADRSNPDAYQNTYLSAQSNLAHALLRSGRELQRWIFVSSTRVYGFSDGRWVGESTPPHIRDRLAETLLRAEEFTHALPWPTCVVRSAGIYGPGRNRLLDQCLRQERPLPPPGVYTNRIHRDDCARALLHLLRLPMADLPPTILAADRDPAESRTFLTWIYQQLGRTPPDLGPADRPRGGNKRCRSDLLLQTGFQFHYPSYRDGYPALIQSVLSTPPADS
ncbi:MAG: NAD-dependent epimerase/dehydratase family protein [Verrucomicrobiota bacterium]|jgi:nucleoside-diphosphate-sugar epimerase